LGLGFDLGLRSEEIGGYERRREFLGLSAAAFLAKLASSADDVVWILPFLVDRRQRLVNCLAYILTVEFICFLSWLIAFASREGLEAIFESVGIDEDPELILEGIGTGLIGLLALYLFIKWLKGDDSDDENEAGAAEEEEEDEEEE